MNCRTIILGMFVCTTLATTEVSAEVWSPWADLANFKPAQSELIAARTNRGHPEVEFDVQNISGGEGDAINVDEYVVRIDAMPNGWDKVQFFKHVRTNLSDYLDQSVAEFRPLADGDRTDWTAETNARLGTIMVFEIKTFAGGFDDGAVVVSQTGDNTWIFSPIEDGFFGDFGTHPVAGNRQFGLRDSGGGTEFFTRAFDRVYPLHVSVAEQRAFEEADNLWRSLQKKLVEFVIENGGTATSLSPVVPGGNDPGRKPQYLDVCADPTIDLSC